MAMMHGFLHTIEERTVHPVEQKETYSGLEMHRLNKFFLSAVNIETPQSVAK